MDNLPFPHITPQEARSILDPLCKQGGCHMFAPGTPERAECEGACRLSNSASGVISGRLSTTLNIRPQRFPSDFQKQAAAASMMATLRPPSPLATLDYAALEMRLISKG